MVSMSEELNLTENNESTSETSSGSDDIFYGDANCDNEISIADAVIIMQAISNSDEYKLSEQGEKNADVVGNDGVTSKDALVIQMINADVIKQSDLPLEKLD